MKKYFLTSLVALTTCSAYGAFDFENYVPTLGTNSAYTMSFTSVSGTSAPNTITTYLVDYNDYSITPVYYTYSATYGSPTNNRRIIDSNSDINEHFISNAYESNTPVQGSAIYNDGFTINSVTGDFIGNVNWSNGGAIYNNGGTINNITGDFIENQALYGAGNHGAYNKSGAINNTGGTIGSIFGNFIGNTATSYGGAIYNYGGTINSVDGAFIGNATGGGGAPGAAIYNNGVIENINGDFISNTSSHSSGAIYNNGNINAITGDFIGNTAWLKGGAIYNSGNIESIVADFIGNSATYTYGGAIYNDWFIGAISGNFIGNYTVESFGGAIYTTENLKFLSDSDSYVISGNRGGTTDAAITMDGLDLSLTFENNQNTSYTVNDEINALAQNPYNLYVIGDGSGYTAFNNNIDNVNTVNINNGKLVFGQTPDYYSGTADIGRFGGAPTMNLQNGTFHIANGYTETITLTGLNSIGNSNFLAIDLDIDNNSADFINITDTISGQINLVVESLSNLDIDDNIIWFADVNSDNLYSFTLYSVSGLDYDLGLYFDQDDYKYGLVKKENSNIPEQLNNLVLPTEVVQMADYASRTVVHTVQKLTNSMQKRVGELQWLLKMPESESDVDIDGQSDFNNAFWARDIYKNFDTKDTSVGLSGLEFGYDRIISSTNDYKWYLGGLGYMSGGDSKFKTATLDINGYGFGIYAMMLEKSGWFADFVFRQHFINIEDSGQKTDYTASSANIEIGKEFVFGNNADDADNTDELNWFIKPSLEATYIKITGADIGDYKVQDSTTQMLSLSVLAGPRWIFENGRKFQLYGKLGYTLDNSDDIDVIVNGVSTQQTMYANTLETGLGLDFRGADNSTNIYIQASYITGSDYSEISGNLGLRYAF